MTALTILGWLLQAAILLITGIHVIRVNYEFNVAVAAHDEKMAYHKAERREWTVSVGFTLAGLMALLHVTSSMQFMWGIALPIIWLIGIELGRIVLKYCMCS